MVLKKRNPRKHGTKKNEIQENMVLKKRNPRKHGTQKNEIQENMVLKKRNSTICNSRITETMVLKKRNPRKHIVEFRFLSTMFSWISFFEYHGFCNS